MTTEQIEKVLEFGGLEWLESDAGGKLWENNYENQKYAKDWLKDLTFIHMAEWKLIRDAHISRKTVDYLETGEVSINYSECHRQYHTDDVRYFQTVASGEGKDIQSAKLNAILNYIEGK